VECWGLGADGSRTGVVAKPHRDQGYSATADFRQGYIADVWVWGR
jgi:hypothetical protein